MVNLGTQLVNIIMKLARRARRRHAQPHDIAMGTAHHELQWGKFVCTHLCIDHMYFFCREMENLVNLLLLCYGAESPVAEAHVAQQRGPKPPPEETRGASGCGQPHH